MPHDHHRFHRQQNQHPDQRETLFRGLPNHQREMYPNYPDYLY
jgi:hypothetical protein